ncbi:MAG: hypothetical protein ACKKMO_02370 [Candidatus Nealsonbacteria bacterium]
MTKRFIYHQRQRVACELSLIASIKNNLNTLAEEMKKDKDVKKVLDEFEEALSQKILFGKAFWEARKSLLEIGKWEKLSLYSEILIMIEEKKTLEKIIDLVKITIPLYKWDSNTEWLWNEYKDLEYRVDKRICEIVREHPVWKNFLVYIYGIGEHLAALVIGGFASGFREGEGIEHFKTVSQMWAFAGLNVVDGKAPKRERNKKITFSSSLKSSLLGRLGSSFLRQSAEKSGYRGYYDESKASLYERFQREERKIVPSSKLPKDERGKRHETPEVISEGHVHRMALRKAIKLFVSHLWEEWRKVEGLPAGKAYVLEKLGHNSYIAPFRDKD